MYKYRTCTDYNLCYNKSFISMIAKHAIKPSGIIHQLATKRMTMYDVIGIGNALLDTEFSTSAAFVQQAGLTLGNMTLCDTKQQQNLLALLNSKHINASKKTSGGSAANTLACFGALGGSAYYHCAVGDDDAGQFFLDDLTSFGVNTNADFAKNTGTTGSCVVLVSEDGERTMQTDLGISASINETNVDFSILPKTKWLYLEGYLAMSENASGAIAKLRQQAGVHNVKVAVSFADPAVVKFAKDGLLNMLDGGVHAIFCNLEEAQLFTEKKQRKACVKALLEHANIAVMTCGKDTILIGEKTDGEPIITEVAALNAAVIDTNGAGDNFAGAFLYALNEHYDIKTCATLGASVAKAVIEQFGARLDKMAYLQIKQNVL